MKRSGISLIEVLVAMVVVAVVSLGFVSFQGAMVKANQNEKDRTFAMQKAIQMMEELKAKVAADAATVLDDYNNGDTSYSFYLTTESVSSPGDPLSDNIGVPVASYRYVRQIEVKPLPRDKGARQVSIRVYRSNSKSSAARATVNGSPLPALATLTNIFKTPPVIVEPSQLYNIYTLRMDGIIPGKWTNSSYSNPGWFGGFENTAISYLKGANPGLEIAKTDIHLPAYGRDPWYSPIYNTSSYYHFKDGIGFGIWDVARVPLEKVYFLLGSAALERSWETFAHGPFRKTVTGPGAVSEGNGTYTPNYYGGNPLTLDFRHRDSRPIADQFNHALRYEEEKEKIEAASPNHGSPMTLRYLLDQMLEKKRRNVIISNTHGEVFPMIPMRNYSDPAKVPYEPNTTTILDNWGVVAPSSDAAREGAKARLVTHPNKLEYAQSDWVELRVYPFLTEDIENEPPDAYREATIVLRDVASNLVDVVSGGTEVNDVLVDVVHKVDIERDFGWPIGKLDLRAYDRFPVWPAGRSGMVTDVTNEYQVSVERKTTADASMGYGPNDLVVRVKKVPYTHTLVHNEWRIASPYSGEWYGIHKNKNLYGMHYYPDPLLPGLENDNNDKDKWPRNTARVFIKLKLKNPDNLEVLTSIGSEQNLNKHKVPNRSRTWAYVGLPAPESERYQLVGDPRHNPYEDVRADRRYNRYWADLNDNAYQADTSQDWNKFPSTANGWGGGKTDGKHDADVPAYFALWRKALINSNSMLCQPTGNAFRIVALGAEYGGETWQGSVQHSERPMKDGKYKLETFDEWKDPTVPTTKANKKDEWYAIPWLGEIWPTSRWADWRDTGNLPASDFRRNKVEDVEGYKEMKVDWDRSRYVDNWGSQGFFYADTDFTYKDEWSKADMTANSGKWLDAGLNAKLNPDLDVRFGFLLDDSSNSDRPPSEYGMTRYDLEPGLLKNEPEYYKMGNGRVGLMPFILRDGTDKVGYFLFNSPRTAYSGNNDPYSMMRIYFGAIIQSYMDMASYQFSGPGVKDASVRLKLPPRLKIVQPEDDALVESGSVVIEWAPEWKRWDGQDYSQHWTNYTSGHSPDVVYNLKYSADQGKSWRYVNGGGTAYVGASARFNDSKKLFGTTHTWDMSSLKNGQYQVRIEAYRYNMAEPNTYEYDHHAFTQFSINLAK